MATTCLGPRRGERFVEFGRDGYWAERGGGTNGNQGCGRRSLSRSSPRLLRELSQSKSQPRSTDARIPITGKREGRSAGWPVPARSYPPDAASARHCAANCAVAVSANDESGQAGRNRDRDALAGNREIWRDRREADQAALDLANRRLQPLGHLTAEAKYT